MSPIKVLRKSEVISCTGISHTNLHGLINDKLFPPLISLGGSRAVGILEHEVNAVMLARSAGYDNKQVRALVTKLVEQRQELLDQLLLQLTN